MHNVHPAVKRRRFSEKHPLAAALQPLVHPLDPLEEHQLHLSAPVAHPHTHPLHRIELHSISGDSSSCSCHSFSCSCHSFNCSLRPSGCSRHSFCTSTSRRYYDSGAVSSAPCCSRTVTEQIHPHDPCAELYISHVRSRVGNPHH